MPINGNNILKAMRELKAPSTAEQIACHLAKGTKRKFDVLLQEVVVSLVGGVKFGYIECHNGHYYNIKNTTELFNLLESEDSGQIKRPRPIEETNNPRERKGRLARKRKHNEISDCECESKLETAKAKISKIIDELAERVEGKKPNSVPDQKPKPTAKELNEHIDQSCKMTDSIYEYTSQGHSLHGCDVLQDSVIESALEALDIGRETSSSELEDSTRFTSGINVDQFWYLSDNVFPYQSNSVVTESDVQSEDFDITNKTLYSESKDISYSINETNTNNSCNNLTDEVFTNQSHLSSAGGEFYNSVTESEVPLDANDDFAKNLFLGIALLYKLMNDANDNILTNQSYIVNVDPQSAAELNVQSKTIDFSTEILHSESEVSDNFTNGETFSQYCSLNDNIITDLSHLTTASDIDRESVVVSEQQSEHCDHISFHHEIPASVKESEVPLESCDNTYKNLFLAMAFLYKLVNDANDNILTNQSHIVNDDPQPAAEFNVQSEAIDLGNTTLHSGLEVFSNFFNEETVSQNCTLTEDIIANESHLSTASDIERESIVELKEQSEYRDRTNFYLDKFSGSVTESSEVPLENRDNVNNNLFFGLTGLNKLTETNVDEFHHLTDDGFPYLSHITNVNPQLAAEADVQLKVNNLGNESLHLGVEDFSSFLNEPNNNQYCNLTDDIFTNQSCFLSTGDEFYNSNTESKPPEIHDNDTPFDRLMVLRKLDSDSNDNALIKQNDTTNVDPQQVAESDVQLLANDNGNKTLHSEIEDRNDYVNEIMVSQCENLADDVISIQSHLSTTTVVSHEVVIESVELPEYRDRINDAPQSEKESPDNSLNVANDQDSSAIDNDESFRLELIIPKKILNAADANFHANDNVFKIRSHLSSINIPDIETEVILTVHDNDIQTLDLELNIPESFVQETRSAYIISVTDSPEAQLNDETDDAPIKNEEKL